MIKPFGSDELNPLFVYDSEQHHALAAEAESLPSLLLNSAAAANAVMLGAGYFNPLNGYMNLADALSVAEHLQTTDGLFWPVPIVNLSNDIAAIGNAKRIALRDPNVEGHPVLAIQDIVAIEPVSDEQINAMAQQIFGTNDANHPGVATFTGLGRYLISGPIQVLNFSYFQQDFPDTFRTAVEIRNEIQERGWQKVVAFQTRNPMHRAHEELTKRAIEQADATLLLHPVVGMTKPGDVDHYTRVRAYKALVDRYYDRDRVVLSLLPLAMRLAGPREAVWHAIIRRNHGANHFIVGRDHAGPGNDSYGKPFYGPYDAQELVARHADEIGVRMIPFSEMVYLADEDRYEEASRVMAGARTAAISGTQVREDYLHKGRPLPGWFTRPEVADVLAESYPPRHKQGVVIWFTGLSGAGKSTTAEVLTQLLLEHGRQVTMLDGDVVRTHLSKGLGFSKEDRDINIRRIGYVAAEIVRHGGTVVCAAVSPYRATRNDVRNLAGSDSFVEVFVDTPIEVCEQRDVKGMYAKARRGEIKGFTGIDDPYEAPENPEITLDTVANTPEENAYVIINYLIDQGLIRADERAPQPALIGNGRA